MNTRSAPGRSAYLIWCVGSPKFRARHPGIPHALDALNPDGCTDLIIEVDGDGRLTRVDIELLTVADDLVGRPIEEVLPEVADRLDGLLHRDDHP
ncbi:hypothetical protein [Nocardioides pyridinolyticus]